MGGEISAEELKNSFSQLVKDKGPRIDTSPFPLTEIPCAVGQGQAVEKEREYSIKQALLDLVAVMSRITALVGEIDKRVRKLETDAAQHNSRDRGRI